MVFRRTFKTFVNLYVCIRWSRVGEEREKAVHQLHGERENFEKQLLTLVDQQEKILQEREGIV